MALTVTKLSKYAGRKALLHNLNLTFEPETIYGLLGRNGAGKSTLLNILADRVPASTGQVSLDGKAVHEHDQELQRLYLMSEDNLYPVREHVSDLFKMTAQLYGNFDFELANRLATAFELNVRTRFGKLSTGYRTIFKDIVALCVPCDYILLDEPVLGLDANHRELFYQELLTAYGDRPRTFVVATHIIQEIEGLLNNVIILVDGEVKIAEQVDALMARTYRLSGPTAVMSVFLSDVTVLQQHTFAKDTWAVVTTIGTPTIPQEIQQQRLNLQDLFVALTEDDHEA